MCNCKFHIYINLLGELLRQFTIISKMSDKHLDELQATRQSFFKLQDNFNHNLLVIKELEEDNQKLIVQFDNLKTQYHQEVDQLHGVIGELQNENKKLNTLAKSEVERVRAQLEEETQHIVEMMNQKMMEEKRFQAQKYARQRKQLQTEAQKCEQSLKYYSIQNSKLLETVKQLRNEKDSLETQLAAAFAQKQSYANKFTLHQKELQNMRNAGQEWEKILKDKIKQANREKQKLQQELSQTKMSFKLKLKTIKQEAAKKIEQVQKGKQKQIKVLFQQSKQIKFRYDSVIQQLEKLRAENKNHEKEKNKLEQTVQQLSKQTGSEKEIQYLKKMFEQEKIQLKNQISLVENERNQLKQEMKDLNQRREEVEKAVERLKTALLSGQKQIAESERKNKKLERQIKQMRSQAKKIMETGNFNFAGYQKNDYEDIVNENGVTNNQNVEYSKYFSEDMGPADEMFFMDSSLPKSPKNIARPPVGPSNVNHQLMKKIGQLQAEVDQYKNVIKTMSDEMQKAKSSLSDQIGLKDQQIKLSRDQVYLLRQKINQRQQQLLNLNSLRQKVEEKNYKIQELNNKINTLETQKIQRMSYLTNIEGQIVKIREEFQQVNEKLTSCEQQKKILDEINEDLRGEIHTFKNRIKLYDESQEESFNRDDEQQIFQQIQAPQVGRGRQNVIEQNIKRKRDGRNKSKSDPKRKSNPQAISGHQHKSSINSMKLKDLVLKKKQLQMQGKKMNLEYKQPSNFKNIEKMGTTSQKQIFDNLRQKSKSKQKARERQNKQKIERLKRINAERLMGRNSNIEIQQNLQQNL